MLVVITGISSVLAVRGIQRARFEERAAASRNLAIRALTQLGDDVRLAALLGLEAYRREPTVEARSAVLSVLPALGGYRRIGGLLQHGVPLESVAISPDGRTLASAANDGTVWLWDVATRRRTRPAPDRSRRSGVRRDVQPGRHAAGQRRPTGRCGCGTCAPAGPPAARCRATRRR